MVDCKEKDDLANKIELIGKLNIAQCKLLTEISDKLKELQDEVHKFNILYVGGPPIGLIEKEEEEESKESEEESEEEE